MLASEEYLTSTNLPTEYFSTCLRENILKNISKYSKSAWTYSEKSVAWRPTALMKNRCLTGSQYLVTFTTEILFRSKNSSKQQLWQTVMSFHIAKTLNTLFNRFCNKSNNTVVRKFFFTLKLILFQLVLKMVG